MKLQSFLLATVGCAALCACNSTVDTRPVVLCGDGGICYESGTPYAGLATLHPHTTDADYLDSVVSFEHGTTVDDGAVGNDWDLSLDGADLLFRVNTVTDDQSWIVDLGRISVEDIPESALPTQFHKGRYGAYDEVPAVLEHVYLVRNVDTDTTQYAAFRVVALEQGASVTLQWFRSKDPERFVFPRGESL